VGDRFIDSPEVERITPLRKQRPRLITPPRVLDKGWNRGVSIGQKLITMLIPDTVQQSQVGKQPQLSLPSLRKRKRHVNDALNLQTTSILPLAALALEQGSGIQSPIPEKSPSRFRMGGSVIREGLPQKPLTDPVGRDYLLFRGCASVIILASPT